MLAAIEFDDEAWVGACEVDDVRADLVLSAELPAEQTAISQVAPEEAFRIGLT